MTEPKTKQTRDYVVLLRLPTPAENGRLENYMELGVTQAANAEDACVRAMEVNGLPKGVKLAIAIPVGNWNACRVKEETRPRFEAKRMSAVPETQPTSPDPEDAT